MTARAGLAIALLLLGLAVAVLVPPSAITGVVLVVATVPLALHALRRHRELRRAAAFRDVLHLAAHADTDGFFHGLLEQCQALTRTRAAALFRRDVTTSALQAWGATSEMWMTAAQALLTDAARPTFPEPATASPADARPLGSGPAVVVAWFAPQQGGLVDGLLCLDPAHRLSRDQWASIELMARAAALRLNTLRLQDSLRSSEAVVGALKALTAAPRVPTRAHWWN